MPVTRIFSAQLPTIFGNITKTKKVSQLRDFCGADETRTRDLLRDRQAF